MFVLDYQQGTIRTQITKDIKKANIILKDAKDRKVLQRHWRDENTLEYITITKEIPYWRKK